MMSLNALRASKQAAWRALLLSSLSVAAWAAPHWTTECPQRIEHASWCQLLPSEGLMGLRVPVAGDDDGLWGFVDIAGRMVIAPVFDRVMPFSQGMAAAHKDGKWGFIDGQGKWRFEPQYDDVQPFDSRGIAWAVQQGKLFRLHTDGRALPWLSDVGQFDLDHHDPRDDGAIGVRVTPPSETWHLESGKVVRWPPQVTELGKPDGDVWPVRVHLPSGRVWWGLWRYGQGRWLVSPMALRSESEPRFHGDKVATYRKGVWRFVDLRGQPLSEVSYVEVEMPQPGLWLVSPERSTWEWLNPDLSVRYRAEGVIGSPSHEKWGNGLVFELADKLLLSFPNGRLQFVDTHGFSARLHDGWAWLAPDAADGRPDLIGPGGQSVLSDDERNMLKHHRVEFLWEGRSPQPLGSIRAILHPIDDTSSPGVITADLRVINPADWVSVTPGGAPSDPVVVKRIDGRFGAMDGHGKWVIEPEWLGLEAFQQGLTWGRHLAHEGGHRPVLVRDDGRRVALPDDAFTACRDWTGGWLRCQFLGSESAETSFLDPLTNARVVAPKVDEVREARDSWLFARQSERWGVLGAKGAWHVPPLAESPQAIEWLDEQVVRVAVSQRGGLTHQLWRISDGRALSEPRRGESWQLAPDRYLVAGPQSGVELLDSAGRVVLRHPWWGTNPRSQMGLAWTDPGQQLARILADGTLMPSPVHADEDTDSSSGRDEEAIDAQAVRGWQLRLSARCGQLIVKGPNGRQTWPERPVRCHQR